MLETLPRSCSLSSVPGKLEEPIFRFFYVCQDFGNSAGRHHLVIDLFFFSPSAGRAVPSVAISIGSFLLFLPHFSLAHGRKLKVFVHVSLPPAL